MTLPLDPEPDKEQPMTTTDAPPLDTTDAHAVEKPAANLPAIPDAPGELAVPEEDWMANEAKAFDDGSELYVEHFGLSLPRIKTDFGKNGTGFVFPDDSRSLALSVVLLAYPPSRQWWSKSIEEGGGGTPPECRSIDMVVPDESSPDRQSDTCASCPMSQWATSEAGDRIKPKCSEAVNCFVWEADTDAFYWMRFAGTGLAPFRSHISAIRSRRLYPFGVETLVTLEKESKGALEWLRPRFAIGRILERPEVAPLREIAQAAMAYFGQVAEVLATEDRSSDEGGPGPFDGKPTDPTGGHSQEPF